MEQTKTQQKMNNIDQNNSLKNYIYRDWQTSRQKKHYREQLIILIILLSRILKELKY